MADALDLGSSSSWNGGSNPPPRTKGANLEYEISKDMATVKEFELRVPGTELENLIDQEAEQLRKNLKLNGFRKGKVPKTLIKTRYFNDLKARALDKLLTNTYLKFLQEIKWRPAAQAELKNIEEGEKIKFQLRVEVIPDFDVDNYIGIEVLKEEPIPDDLLLKQAMKDLQEKYGHRREISRPAAVDDFVIGEFTIEKDGEIKLQEKNSSFRIGDRSLPDEFNRILVGIKKGETKEVEIGDQKYSITVHRIEEQVVPEIDDAFAQKLGYKNLKELKEKLLTEMKENEKVRETDELKESIAHILLEHHQFPLPDSLIQREYEKLLKDFELPNSDSNKERFWPRAEKRARLNLIIDKIASKEEIKISESEIEDMIKKLNLKANKEITEYLRIMLTRERTFEFLLKNAKITERNRIISPKEAINDTGSIRH